MGTELPTKVMLGQTLVLMQMTFLNNARKECRLVLSRTSCLSRVCSSFSNWLFFRYLQVIFLSHDKNENFRIYITTVFIQKRNKRVEKVGGCLQDFEIS
jgi:hypothetical protein